MHSETFVLLYIVYSMSDVGFGLDTIEHTDFCLTSNSVISSLLENKLEPIKMSLVLSKQHNKDSFNSNFFKKMCLSFSLT